MTVKTHELKTLGHKTQAHDNPVSFCQNIKIHVVFHNSKVKTHSLQLIVELTELRALAQMNHI